MRFVTMFKTILRARQLPVLLMSTLLLICGCADESARQSTAAKRIRERAARRSRTSKSTKPIARKPAVSKLTAPKRSSEIRLDGILDEADWVRAGQTGPLVNTLTGAPGAFHAEARVLHDSQALYVAFQVTDSRLIAPHPNQDDHLWENDTVEIMIDPDGDQRNYFELQVSPRGVSFDTRYDTRRKPQPFGHVDWSSEVQSAVALDGIVDDGADDEKYTVEMRIPIAALKGNGISAPVPTKGQSYRMNFFVMNRLPGRQQAVGWSAPLMGDFHIVDRFGIVTFDD